MDSMLHERLLAAAGKRSFRHLSQMTGVNAESVRRYMQGATPSVEFVAKLCREAGINADWLLTGRGPMRAADVKREALAGADATDLMSAVAGTMEGLIERVDRLDVFTQTLDVRLRSASVAVAAEAEPKPSERAEGSVATMEGKRTDGQPKDDRTTGSAGGAESHASRIGRAASKRSHPPAD